MKPILSFEHVTYRYPGVASAALDDVTLEVHPGELCLVAGLSGHGKSTLLRAACGLVPHFHGGRFAGHVRLAGLDTREHSPARLGALAGALFQDPETQLVTSSVRSELALSLESRGHGATAVARGVEEVALALGLDALLDRSTHELSGGEQQRVALAAALAGRPPVVLLDEPTSQLDPVAGDELIGLLRRLNQEWETTILLAEHRLERCLSAADRVIAMHAGALAHDGDPSIVSSLGKRRRAGAADAGRQDVRARGAEAAAGRREPGAQDPRARAFWQTGRGRRPAQPLARRGHRRRTRAGSVAPARRVA